MGPQTARALCCVLLTVLSGVAFAQTTGTVNPSTVTAKPNPPPAGPAADEEPPPGGCMPIGVTVSGEIVFPFQCKGFIERQKAADNRPTATEDQPAQAKPAAAKVKPTAKEKPTAAAAEEKPATADAKPAAAEEKPTEEKSAAAEDQPAAAEEKPAAAAEKTAAKQSEGAPGSGKPAAERLEAVPLPRRAELKPVGPPGCTHFRSYDPVSATYRAYGGQRRQCR
jgi:hypothetical protein